MSVRFYSHGYACQDIRGYLLTPFSIGAIILLSAAQGLQ